MHDPFILRSGGRHSVGLRRSAFTVASLTVLYTAFAGAPARAGDSALETYGDIAQFAIPATAGVISLAKEDMNGALQLGAGTLITTGAVLALKYAVNTTRPNGDPRSFPSGHTAAAFSGASYLHYRYGWQYGLPAYVAAGVVGYSRVEANEHFWYDVVGGAAIANAIAYVFTDTLDEKVVIVPVLNLGKKNFGILASVRF